MLSYFYKKSKWKLNKYLYKIHNKRKALELECSQVVKIAFENNSENSWFMKPQLEFEQIETLRIVYII